MTNNTLTLQSKIKTLSIDIETYSSIDLQNDGIYKYADAEDFALLLFGFSINDDSVKVIDVARGELIPDVVLNALMDEKIIKWAWNARFERICLSRYLRDLGYYFNSDCLESMTYLDPFSWKCSMTFAKALGLPKSLKDAGAFFDLEEQKMADGKDLIQYFSLPHNVQDDSFNCTRNMPADNLEKWEAFKAYNKRDVEVEIALRHKLALLSESDFIWDEYWLQERLCDREQSAVSVKLGQMNYLTDVK